jgi:hypothetical protein
MMDKHNNTAVYMYTTYFSFISIGHKGIIIRCYSKHNSALLFDSSTIYNTNAALSFVIFQFLELKTSSSSSVVIDVYVRLL